MIIEFIGGPKDGELTAVEDYRNFVFFQSIPGMSSQDKIIGYRYDIIKEGPQPYRAVLVDTV